MVVNTSWVRTLEQMAPRGGLGAFRSLWLAPGRPAAAPKEGRRSYASRRRLSKKVAAPLSSSPMKRFEAQGACTPLGLKLPWLDEFRNYFLYENILETNPHFQQVEALTSQTINTL